MKRNATEGFVPVGSVVAKLAGDLLENPRTRAASLASVWRAVAGEHTASHSEPGRLINGLLTIRVDSSVWVSQLMHMKVQLLQAFQERAPSSGVRDLRFREESLKNQIHASMKPPPPLPPPLPQEREKAKEMVAGVEDTEIRTLLLKLSETFLVRKRDG